MSARVIPQEVPFGGIDLAAWSPDDRFVVTLSTTSRTLLVWDAGGDGTIVNRAALPSFGPDLPEAYALAMSGDGVLTMRLGQYDGVAKRCRRLTLTLPLAAPGARTVGEDTTVRGECPEAPGVPPLLASHDRKLRLKTGILSLLTGPEIVTAAGKRVRVLDKPGPIAIYAAALNPDGRRLAMLTTSGDAAKRTRILTFDLGSAHFGPAIVAGTSDDGIAWLDGEHLLLFERLVATDDPAAPPRSDGIGPAPAPPRIVEAATGRAATPPIAARCRVVAGGPDLLVGMGLAACSESRSARGLERWSRAGGWRSVNEAAFTGTRTIALVLSADRSAAVAHVVPANGSGQAALVAVDLASGAVLGRTVLRAADGGWPGVRDLAFAPDGKTVALRLDGAAYRWPMSGAPVAVAAAERASFPLAVATGDAAGSAWYESDFDNLGIAAVRVDGGKRVARSLYSGLIDEGAIPRSELRWVAMGLGGIRIWSPAAGRDGREPEVLSLQFVEADRFFAATPDGRYDTDAGADTDRFRWVVSDAPLRSLGPQTFMRTYFEPRLSGRLLDCIQARTCAAAFKPAPPVGAINRVLPSVRIAGVAPGAMPDVARVDLEVRGGADSTAANGLTRTDAYDLRLFRDGKMVGQSPSGEGGTDLAGWRSSNRVKAGADGVARVRMTVRLPTGADAAKSVFTAYAFNEDRVKSETARLVYARPAVAARAPRVFAVAVGVDDYDEARLRLNFAGGDARLIAARVAAMPGASVRAVTLTDKGATRAAIGDVLAILGGTPREPALSRLRAVGVDATVLDAATPDDVVILSFSGHGWTDASGAFFVLPSDARWPAEAEVPDRATLLSAADLTRMLRPVDAGEIAFVIDACHSAASVDAGGFKPGPMGDAGLGQLAFDKGIRILAASQADDVALESGTLRQGLLTYALGEEGLTADGGRADLNGDGRITIDEWLRYGAARLPALSRDVRAGRLTGTRGFVLLATPGKELKPQEPALFDFTGRPSATVLRRLR